MISNVNQNAVPCGVILLERSAEPRPISSRTKLFALVILEDRQEKLLFREEKKPSSARNADSEVQAQAEQRDSEQILKQQRLSGGAFFFKNLGSSSLPFVEHYSGAKITALCSLRLAGTTC